MFDDEVLFPSDEVVSMAVTTYDETVDWIEVLAEVVSTNKCSSSSKHPHLIF